MQTEYLGGGADNMANDNDDSTIFLTRPTQKHKEAHP